MSFPVEPSLRTTPEGVRLFRYPVKEIERLHRGSEKWADITVSVANDKDHLGGLSPDLMDLTCEFSPGTGDQATFAVRGVDVRYTQSDARIRVINNSGLVDETVMPAPQDERGRVSVHLLFDRTSLEIFVNDGLSVATLNCVPVNSKLSVEGPEAMKINQLVVHELGSIWKQKAR
jgi:sucrose-6-phosphate hydrolase SacC (GH32 family)